ncbi:glutathione S-transferase family protein [Haladaptatus sp. GCM10025707]|uniref:glutathione S-transferase family protein n=1 Tax=unclassified Haladaptatus TaxID=2622732 RepID=UPI0023E7A70D|nr:MULTISPECIES: glutathione S-transferase family protein [unclassified Haladaptatus]
MKMFKNGEWGHHYESTNLDGEFERQSTMFRDWIEDDPEAEYPAEAGRYHLYISWACPWAHRTALIRSLRGLEDVISMDVVDPYRDEGGWQFTPEKAGCTADSINDFDYLRETYLEADPNVTGRVTVPVLWDKETGTIVNNESEEILRMLDTAFADFGNTEVTLYPEGYREEIDDIIDAIYEPINNGVYRAGFADSQDAYENAVTELFDNLDYWEDVLEDQRYLAGDRLTEADICMFTTLVRFDPVYVNHFRCNLRRIADYPNLWNYLKDLYQTPGVAETVDFAHIKEHYFTTHESLNPKGIIPKGPVLDFEEPHDRDRLAGRPPEALVQ